MKSNLTFFIVAFFAIVIYRCSPSNNPEPEVAADVKAWVEPAIVPYGGNATLFWESTNVASVTKDGAQVPTKGSEELKALTSNISYTLIFKGVNGQIITKTVDIVVEANPDKARTDSLCLNKYWKRISTKVLLSNGVWDTVPLGEEQLSLKDFYYPNGTMETFRPSDGVLVGNSKWAWYGKNSIIWNGLQTTTYKMTNSTIEFYSSDGKTVSLYKFYPL